MPEELRAVWTDLYRFYEQHRGLGNTVDDWMKTSEESAALVAKHRNFLCERMMMALLDVLEKERKEKDNHAD